MEIDHIIPKSPGGKDEYKQESPATGEACFGESVKALMTL
nr:HNH endonuclease signature motif containing protein [Anabaena sphaerica]